MAFDETEQMQPVLGQDFVLHPCLMVLSGTSTGNTYRLLPGVSVIGRAPDCDIVLNDRGISRRHAELTLTTEGRVRLCDLGSTNGTFVDTEPVNKERILEGGERITLGSEVKLKFDYWAPSEEQLLESAIRDALTGALNRRYFDQRLSEECALSRRHGKPLACAFIDADHFKSVNDRYGHGVGDEVLKELVRRVDELKRQEDTLARYGGEEFVLLLPSTDLEGAHRLMERVRSRVAEAPILAGELAVEVTVSVGVAEFRERDEELVEQADKALYKAKEQGRNRVVLETDL